MKIKNLLFFTLLPFVVAGSIYVYKEHQATNAFAYGPLTIDLGVPEDAPIFSVVGMLPGDCQSHTIHITNDSQKSFDLVVHTSNVQDNDSLSSVMSMVVTKDEETLYKDTLEKFFTDSRAMGGVSLFSINPRENKEVKFEVCLDTQANNDYQNSKLIFDFIFGEDLSLVKLPKECESLKGRIAFIHKSKDVGRILGTNANELIYSHGGHDDVDGGGGDDCIVDSDGHGTVVHKEPKHKQNKGLWQSIKHIMRLTQNDTKRNI